MKTLKFKVIKNIDLQLCGTNETIFKDQTLMFVADDNDCIHLIFNNGKQFITKSIALNVAQELLIQLSRNKQIKKFYEQNDLLDLILGIHYGS